MNELIKELAEQAGSTHKQNLGVYQFYTDELEKFAELIVKECLSYMEDGDIDFVKFMIKRNFGVEE
jgi:hypothetical protein